MSAKAFRVKFFQLNNCFYQQGCPICLPHCRRRSANARRAGICRRLTLTLEHIDDSFASIKWNQVPQPPKNPHNLIHDGQVAFPILAATEMTFVSYRNNRLPQRNQRRRSILTATSRLATKVVELRIYSTEPTRNVLTMRDVGKKKPIWICSFTLMATRLDRKLITSEQIARHLRPCA